MREPYYAKGQLLAGIEDQFWVRVWFLEILKGGLQGPYQDIVLLNSGFALWLARLARSVQEGIEKSRLSIKTGRALQVLQTLRRITNERN